MTQAVISDKLPTPGDVKQRKFDAQAPARPPSDDCRSAQRDLAAQSDSADIARANQRLAQQLNEPRGSEIGSSQQARERVAQLQLEIASNPAAVVRAFGNLNQNAFEAAIAEPSD